MFNLFADTQRQLQDLLLETRSYLGLQKKAFLVETRDKLAILLSRLAIAVVCLVLGGMVLIFFCFFLAYIIGQALGNVALGFACVVGIVLLLFAIFWHWRTKWVIIPITKMMISLFTTDEEETLSAEDVNTRLQNSRTRMSESFNSLMDKGEKPANNVQAVGNWMSRGFAVYEGIRIGLSVMRTIGSLFGTRRKR